MKLMRWRRSERDRRDACRKRCGGVPRYGNVCVQRGVRLAVKMTRADDADRTEQVQEKASVEEISLPPLTKMSPSATLKVRAALMQQPDKSWHCWQWDACLECVWQRSVQ